MTSLLHILPLLLLLSTLNLVTSFAAVTRRDASSTRPPSRLHLFDLFGGSGIPTSPAERYVTTIWVIVLHLCSRLIIVYRIHVRLITKSYLFHQGPTSRFRRASGLGQTQESRFSSH